DVQHQVEPLAGAREVLGAVVDDLVGADRADQLDVVRAADPDDLRAVRLRKLHGERADAAGRAVDQHLLPAFEATGVNEGDQRGELLLSERGDDECAHDRLPYIVSLSYTVRQGGPFR